MSRTTIEIDDRLLADAKQALGVRTKREAVERSLRETLRTQGIHALLARQGRGYGMTLKEFLKSRVDE